MDIVIKEELEFKEEYDEEESKYEPIVKNLISPTCIIKEKKRGKQANCSYCNKLITHMSPYKRKRHYATHQFDKKSLECEHCTRQFTSAVNLEIHMRIHLGNTFKCKHCSKKFARNENLTKHMRMHSKEFSHCDICKKKFVWKNSVRLHMPIHFNNKNKVPRKVGHDTFACVFCKKVYTRERDLLLHAVVHFKQHPYQCKKCGKHYFRKSSLTRHLRNHKRKKMYSCGKCDKSYTRKYHLDSHACTFLTLQCDFCSRRLGSKKSMENHIMKYHLNIRNAYYYCTKCFKIFSVFGNARMHKATSHADAKVILMFLTAEEMKNAIQYDLVKFNDIKLIKTPSVPLVSSVKIDYY